MNLAKSPSCATEVCALITQERMARESVYRELEEAYRRLPEAQQQVVISEAHMKVADIAIEAAENTSKLIEDELALHIAIVESLRQELEGPTQRKGIDCCQSGG